ncbi:MAG: Hsp20/alpha crystallin family protein [Bacillus sp. (in: firmicutes)]
MNPWNFLFPFQKYMKQFTQGSSGSHDFESMMKKMFEEMSKNSYSNPDQTLWPEPSVQREKKPESSLLHAELFETHSDIYIRFPVESSTSLRSIKIFHTSNTAIIEGYPDQKDKHTFTLPALVKKKGSSADYKDGMLEIRFIKASDLHLSEIQISERK